MSRSTGLAKIMSFKMLNIFDAVYTFRYVSGYQTFSLVMIVVYLEIIFIILKTFLCFSQIFDSSRVIYW